MFAHSTDIPMVFWTTHMIMNISRDNHNEAWISFHYLKWAL